MVVLWGRWTIVSSVVVVRVVGTAGSTTTVLQEERVRSIITASRDAASVFMILGMKEQVYFFFSVTVVFFVIT